MRNEKIWEKAPQAVHTTTLLSIDLMNHATNWRVMRTTTTHWYKNKCDCIMAGGRPKVRRTPTNQHATRLLIKSRCNFNAAMQLENRRQSGSKNKRLRKVLPRKGQDLQNYSVSVLLIVIQLPPPPPLLLLLLTWRSMTQLQLRLPPVFRHRRGSCFHVTTLLMDVSISIQSTDNAHKLSSATV